MTTKKLVGCREEFLSLAEDKLQQRGEPQGMNGRNEKKSRFLSLQSRTACEGTESMCVCVCVCVYVCLCAREQTAVLNHDDDDELLSPDLKIKYCQHTAIIQ
jgi:hypothetical protein